MRGISSKLMLINMLCLLQSLNSPDSRCTLLMCSPALLPPPLLPSLPMDSPEHSPHGPQRPRSQSQTQAGQTTHGHRLLLQGHGHLAQKRREGWGVTLRRVSRAVEEVPTTERLLLRPGGMMFTWFALFVLKFATMLLESTALMLRLLLLLLLLLMLLLTFSTKVRTPAAKAAKSTALEPEMMEVEDALVQDCTWEAIV